MDIPERKELRGANCDYILNIIPEKRLDFGILHQHQKLIDFFNFRSPDD
jgi:hypothetical protein